MHISKVMGKRCCGVHKGDSVKGFLQKEDHTVSPTQAPYPGACCDLIYSRLFGYSIIPGSPAGRPYAETAYACGSLQDGTDPSPKTTRHTLQQ